MSRKSVSYSTALPVVSVLPTPTAALKGSLVEFNGLPYWCTGTQWVGMASSVVQVVAGTIPVLSGTTQMPITSTPTASTGTLAWQQDITVTTGSRILLKCQLMADHSTRPRNINAAFFRDGTLIGMTSMAIDNSGTPNSVSYMDYDQNMGPGVHTYQCRIGASGSGTWYLNQDKNGARWGGGFLNTFSLTEIL